jgi:hypothetical protein
MNLICEARKFNQVFDDLPDNVQQFYKKADRIGKSKLVNALIQKNGKGNYVTDLASPIMTQVNEYCFSKHYSKKAAGSKTN